MKAVGARLPRYDGIAHVTGRTQYVDDWRVPGMLWCKGLRSPHESARIVRVDTSKAEALPGVHAVALHHDIPTNVVGHLAALGVPADEPYLAVDEVRYRGQLIGGVAAEDEATALEAVSLIEVEYEVREPFLDVRHAFDADTMQVTPDGNVFFYDPYDSRRVTKGDIGWAFEHADVIVQGAYRPAAIEQAPTETQAALVWPQPDGRIVVYSCTQAMYFSMGVLAQHLNLPLNRFKFVGGTVGGGFGGKVDTATEPLCAVLALKAQRPVKWRFSREEEFLAGSTRASWHVEMADAVTEDGWLLGRKVLTLHDAGAYTRFSSYGATKHSFHLGGAYTVPHMQTEAFVIWTNHVPTTAMRGFGVTSASFAIEMQMTRTANVLGVDPWEYRLKNANRIGDLAPCRVVLDDPSTVQTIQAVAGAIGHELSAEYRTMTNAEREGAMLPSHLVDQMATAKLADPRGEAMKQRGRGLAAIEYPTGMNQGGDPSQAWIKMKPDGRVDVFAGTVDLGQGSKTVHTQIVADTLGVPYDWVTMDVSNTDSSPLCTGTFASRGTFIGGNAVAVAAGKVKTKLLEVAGQLMEIDPADLEVVDGEVVARGVPDKKMPIPDVAGGATWVVGDMITGAGAWMKPYSVPDPDTGECEPHAAISYAACVAEVEVDDETGAVTVLRLVQSYDVGRAINPTLVEGQIEGGAMMGLGLGLLEASYPNYPSNDHRGGEFGSYLAPALADMPELTAVIVENPSVDGPFGAKAIGEMANNAQAPAICAAIHDAVGVWVTEQPATPERVLRALEAKREGRGEPRRDGKRVIFDEEISVASLADEQSKVKRYFEFDA